MMKLDRRTALRGFMGGAAATVGLPLLDILMDGNSQVLAATRAPTWVLEGLTVENCSCKAFCVSNLGYKVNGWHRGACVWAIRNGHSDGVDLAGTSAAMAYEMPDDNTSAKGTVRIYIGESANAVQRKELEAIFMGRRGGVFSMFGDSLSNKLPVRASAISLVDGDTPSATVGDVGHVVLRRHKTLSGKQTVLKDAVYPETFGVTVEYLCDATGSYWSDPEIPAWRSGAGGIAAFKLLG